MLIDEHEEKNLPLFMDHKTARIYFKERYGSLFVMVSSRYVKGKKVFSYHLVTDKEAYLKVKNESEGNIARELDLQECYQAIEITENGKVSIYY